MGPKGGSPGVKAKRLQGCGPRGSPESHHILLGMWGSVREWTFTLPRQLPLWEMESRWTPEISESNFKGQISMACGVLYITGKLLERRCLKWCRIAHLDIWNTSYGQKKSGIDLFSMFDLKVRHGVRNSRQELQLCFRPCHDQTLQSGDICVQSPKTPTGTILGLHFRSPGKKSHLDAASTESCRIYYKGEGGGFPQVWAVVSLVCPCCSWFVLAPRVL